MEKDTNISKIVKVKATKEEIDSALKDLEWEGRDNYGKHYYIMTEPIDGDFQIGEYVVAVYPLENSFKVEIDKRDYPRGKTWEAKIDLDDNASFIKDAIETYKEKVSLKEKIKNEKENNTKKE